MILKKLLLLLFLAVAMPSLFAQSTGVLRYTNSTDGYVLAYSCNYPLVSPIDIVIAPGDTGSFTYTVGDISGGGDTYLGATVSGPWSNEHYIYPWPGDGGNGSEYDVFITGSLASGFSWSGGYVSSPTPTPTPTGTPLGTTVVDSAVEYELLWLLLPAGFIVGWFLLSPLDRN